MTFDEYQDFVESVSNPENDVVTDLCMVLGLGGESGEIEDLFKKHYAHGHPLDQDKLVKELGDCTWYIAEIARRNGWRFSEIIEANIKKLSKRYEGGFSYEKSINRAE